MSTIATLCFVVKKQKILLIHKKRGFGEGYWNGPGGKVQAGETYVECVTRELQEEVGITPLNPVNRGILEFYFGNGKTNADWVVHVFIANKYEGEIKESDEARPQWFDIGDIPYESMWEDDKFWLPEVLNGKDIKGKFLFSEDMSTLIEHELDVSE
jgi:8-oxo-dGTP diphosphatase